MAIKFGMTLAQIFNQLVRGYQKIRGTEPKGLDLIKIKQEALQRFKDMNKVVDMEGNVIDTSKGIMGGRQIQDVEDAGEGFIEFVRRTDPEGAAKLQKEEDRIRAMIEAANKRAAKNLKDKKKKLDDPDDMAQGGRAGFKLGSIDKARRAFLKTIGAAGAGIGALKTGILSLGQKAAPMVEAARETVTQAPSYFFDLVAKIKMLGKPGISISDRQNVTNYKNYELTEDVTTGDIRITKQKGDPDAPGYREEVMEYNKGGVPDEDIGMTKESYDEATLFPDMDGKMKDIEDGIEPDSIQEIIEETTKQTPSIKKAGGGIATMLGE